MKRFWKKAVTGGGVLLFAVMLSVAALAGVGSNTGTVTTEYHIVDTSAATGSLQGRGYVGGHTHRWDVAVGTYLSKELARTIATTHSQFHGSGYAGQIQQFGTLSNLEFLTSDLQQFGNAGDQLEDLYTQICQDLVAQGGRGSYNITNTFTGTEEYALFGGVLGDGVLIGDGDTAAYAAAGTITVVTGQANVDFYQVNGSVFVSPLVLDLDADSRLMASNGQWRVHRGFDKSHVAMFDWNGNGFAMLTEWVGPNDGLLVQPKADGTIDGTCLFGSMTGMTDGYEALAAARDANADLKVDGQELAGLQVWTDKNGDAVAQAGELSTVEELGITEINLRHDNMKSSFVRNGETLTMWDWWPNAMDLRKQQAPSK